VEAATSFTAGGLIGTALALGVQAIASPAARDRKKIVLRMNVSPELMATKDAPFQFHVRSELNERYEIVSNDRFADRRNIASVVAGRIRPAAFSRAMVVGRPWCALRSFC
jgi:hypothetical protein